MKFIPREEQKEVLKYTSGTMGISAVPGSGKTATLSALAADLVERILAGKDDVLDYSDKAEEVLVVSFSRTAVSNFQARIGDLLRERGMTPGLGYTVKTLHSFAAEIIRGHEHLVGMTGDWETLTDAEAKELLRQAVDLWLNNNGRKMFNLVVKPNLVEESKERFFKKQWAEDLTKISSNVISKLKDYCISPEEFRQRKELMEDSFGRALLDMISDIYTCYQEKLRHHPAMDFSDLMFNCFRVLQADADYLKSLQKKYIYVLEDEAQDSSLIQENVLQLLTSGHGNWVRVGDPNQAINETFTTASPEFLKAFLKKAKNRVPLNRAGRSQLSIIKIANRATRYVSNNFSCVECRNALTEPYIRRTLENDIQKNPDEEPLRVSFYNRQLSKDEEINMVCNLASEHVKKYPKETVAILVPTNQHGGEIAKKLELLSVPYIEVLSSNQKTRSAVEDIAAILHWLSSPLDKECLVKMLKQIFNEQKQGEFFISAEDGVLVESAVRSIENIEEFLYPVNKDELDNLVSGFGLNEFLLQSVFRFRYFICRWLESRFLSVDQLVLFIAQDLFDDPDNLSCANQVGAQLKKIKKIYSDYTDYTLGDLAEKAKDISNNLKINAGLYGAELEYNPNAHPGKVAVITYHSAKGLEWDQVFLMRASNYYFPKNDSRAYADRYRTGKDYVRNNLSIQAEILQALKVIMDPTGKLKFHINDGSYSEWYDYISERCRLFYVGITRARKGLFVSYSGKPSELFSQLYNEWSQKK